jgi:UV DNA damage repair endonuclease
MTTKRIGFACKFSEIKNPTGKIISVPELNFKTTTISSLDKKSKDIAGDHLLSLVKHNLRATYNLVQKISTLPLHLRMVRLGSDVLPAYTHSNWKWFYQQSTIQSLLGTELLKIGEYARKHDIRLSFHPGQFCVLASDKPSVVDNSIEEFEYHTDIVRFMGYGKSFQDFKINVHIAGANGPAGIISALARLSPEARNCITIENSETTWGLEHSLELANHVALVLDIHHHFIHSGEYIQATDDRIKIINDSWRGVRPVIHYSLSREDYLINHSSDALPDMDTLLSQGYNKKGLRAHSDYYWNKPANEWALSHIEWADIMCESKAKNLASFALANQLQL